MKQETRVALVTGGNRGIGLAVVEALARAGLNVWLGSRALPAGEREAGRLRAAGLAVEAVQLDVADAASLARAVDTLGARGVDVLVNNAGVYPEGGLLEVEDAVVREAMEVHFFGPLALCRALAPGMVARGYGRIVNVTSGYGSFAEGLEGPGAYSVSKAALNALTVKVAQEVGPKVLVNAACPGWVRTRMGGATAPKTPEEGADTVVLLATLPAGGPTGAVFRDRQPVDW